MEISTMLFLAMVVWWVRATPEEGAAAWFWVSGGLGLIALLLETLI